MSRPFLTVKTDETERQGDRDRDSLPPFLSPHISSNFIRTDLYRLLFFLQVRINCALNQCQIQECVSVTGNHGLPGNEPSSILSQLPPVVPHARQMVNSSFPKKASRIEPQKHFEEVDVTDVISVNLSKEDEAEEANNRTIYKAHWAYSKLYALVCIVMFIWKILAALTFFNENPFRKDLDPEQVNGQHFGYAMLLWSLNLYYLLPYMGNENNTREEKDTRVSSMFIVGSALNILGTVVFGIYSHEYNAEGQIYDYIGLGEYKTHRTLMIALSVFIDLVFAFMYGNCDLATYDPRKFNNMYKLCSYTGYIRDNPHSKNRLDIELSGCFKIIIRNKGRTAVKFGDQGCVDPTFRSVTSFKVERVVTRIRSFFCCKYKSTQSIDFTVRIMKTIPPGGEIVFIPEPHTVKGAFRIKGLRAFCLDRGDEVETRITLPYDRYPFLTRVEHYNRITDTESKYIQPTTVEGTRAGADA